MQIRTRLAALVVSGAAALSAVAGVPAAAAAPAPPAPRAEQVEVFGHRGASGYRPEHTLTAYELAARMGADYIEPDLVSTKDGVLVSRHEPEIGGTTDVAEHPEFANRRTTKVVDGQRLTGWFAEDFTLAELKTLRAKERIPDLRPGNTAYDGQDPIPTLQEVIDLSKRLSRELHRPIGIAPETKHPSYFRRAGLAIEPRLVAQLTANGLNRPGAKVVVQSFEVGNLQELDEVLQVRLVQLIDSSGAPEDFKEHGDPRTYADMVTPAGLRDVAKYADVIGPDTTVLLPQDDSDHLTGPTTVVADAHAAGLQVVPYTVRAENSFLPADFRSSPDPARHGDVMGYFRLLLDQGIDGVFSDFPDLAVQARDER